MLPESPHFDQLMDAVHWQVAGHFTSQLLCWRHPHCMGTYHLCNEIQKVNDINNFEVAIIIITLLVPRSEHS